MQFVRDYIAHRASSGNIGFVPAYSESETKGCPEKDDSENYEDNDNDLLLLGSDVLEVTSPEMYANTESSTQKLVLKRLPNN